MLMHFFTQHLEELSDKSKLEIRALQEPSSVSHFFFWGKVSFVPALWSIEFQRNPRCCIYFVFKYTTQRPNGGEDRDREERTLTFKT